jgi:hypothetical protein
MATFTTNIINDIVFRKNGVVYFVTPQGYITQLPQYPTVVIDCSLLPTVQPIGDTIKIFGQSFQTGNTNANNTFIVSITNAADTVTALEQAIRRNFVLSDSVNTSIVGDTLTVVYKIAALQSELQSLSPYSYAQLTINTLGTNGIYANNYKVMYNLQFGRKMNDLLTAPFETETDIMTCEPLLDKDGNILPIPLDFRGDITIPYEFDYNNPNVTNSFNYLTYNLKLGDTLTTAIKSPTKIVLDGEISDIATYNVGNYFNNRIEYIIHYNEKQCMFFYLQNGHELPSGKYSVVYTLRNALNVQTQITKTLALPQGYVIQIPVCPFLVGMGTDIVSFDVDVRYDDGTVVRILSDKKSFQIECERTDFVYFHYKNQYGFTDVLKMRYIDSKTLEMNKDNYETYTISNNNILTSVATKDTDKSKDILTYVSDELNDSSAIENEVKAFLLSNDKRIERNGVLIPFVMRTGSINYFSKTDNVTIVIDGYLDK